MLNYVNRVIVGKSNGAANTGSTLATLTRGDILVLDEGMNVLSNGAAKQPFYVAVGTGYAESPFILSAKIDPNFARTTIKDTRAAADQVSYVGFNGTSGTIATPAAGDVAEVVIAFKDRLRLIANRQTRLVLNAIAEGTDVYQVANDLAKQAKMSSPFSDPYGVKVEVVSDGTDLASDNNITVVKGSTKITFATAAEYNTGTPFAVGDYIAIDDVLYKITAIDSLVVTLDRAFTGDSGTVLAANVDHVATPANFGLKISGVSAPYNNPEIDVYEKVVFEVGCNDIVGDATTIISTPVKADLGQGVYEQVKKMEFDAQGYLGNTNLRLWPIPSFDFHAVSGIAYDVMHIVSQDEHEGDLQNQMKSPVGVTLAFGAGANTQRDAVFAILEDALGIAGSLSWVS